MGNKKSFILVAVLLSFLFTAWQCGTNELITPVTHFGNYSAALAPGDNPATATWNFQNGIATDNLGNIWVCDTGNDRLVIMTPDLTSVITQYGGSGTEPGKFNMAFRAAAHPDKNWMYITDMNNNRVQILSYDADYNIQVVKTFGKYGFNNGQFNGPNAVAVAKIDGKIRVVVSDEFAGKETMGRLEIFNEKGKFLSKINKISHNGTDYEMLWPQGITIDKNGHIYVGDTGNYRVLRTDINGNGVPFYDGSIVLPMPVSGNWVFPRGVRAIGDKLYVQDTGANLLTVYTLDGTLIGPLMRDGSPAFYGPIEVTPLKDNPNVLAINENGWPRTTVVDVTDPFNTVTLGTAGRPRLDTGMFSYSPSVKMGNDGDLYVLDAMNFRIQRWKKIADDQYEYNTAYYLAYFGSVLGILKEQNKILVSSPYESKIYIYDAATSTASVFGFLAPEASFGVFGTGDGQLYLPRTITVQGNNIYVADTGNARVSVWEYDPAVGNAVFKKHIGAGQLEYVTGIAEGPNGNVYVADMYQNKINIFGNDGTLLSSFGTLGYEQHNFALPTGVAIADGILYVTDLVSRSLKGFDLEGNFLGIYYRNFGTTLGGMWFSFTPEIVDKTMYLADATHNRVNVFKIAEEVDYIAANPDFYAGLYNFHTKIQTMDSSRYKHCQKANADRFKALSKTTEYISAISEIKTKKAELKALKDAGATTAEISAKKAELKSLILELKKKVLKEVRPVM